MLPLGITDQEITQAYAFAKVTMIDEMESKDKYDRMILVEFLDFIVRCAFFKYQEERHISMLEKTERVLDFLFKTVDVKRQKPNFEIEVSS